MGYNKNWKHVGKVIAGEYENKRIIVTSNNEPIIVVKEEGLSITQYLAFDEYTFVKYEVVSHESKKSTSSAYKKSLIGGFFFGGAGAIAGAASAENEDIYRIAMYYPDGEKSLIEVDGFIFKQIQRCLF